MKVFESSELYKWAFSIYEIALQKKQQSSSFQNFLRYERNIWNPLAFLHAACKGRF